MNWEVILWSSGTIAVVLVACLLIMWIVSARNMKRSRDSMAALQQQIKVGAEVLFAGGIYGKIVKIKDDVVEVEVSKGMVFKISRYSIQAVTD